MPVRLPAPLIHLYAILRPSLLRPDLRVPSIAHVDFLALRKEGFNAVVVDKDNCLTLPHKDELFPPYQAAWSAMLAAFDPGRVLIVSNSAGSSKDRGGIAAESLSFSLGAPVLAHRQPKPACGSDIARYFRGALGAPHTGRSAIAARLKTAKSEERSAEDELLARWRSEVEHGPLCGPLTRPGPDRTLEEKMNTAQMNPNPNPYHPHPAPEPQAASLTVQPSVSKKEPEPLRVIVIGDRLFTDTLLARRLALYIPSLTGHPSTLSIHTTSLPQTRDVLFLRWIENRLSRGRIRSGTADWSRFALVDKSLAVTTSQRWPVVSLNPFRDALTDDGPPMTWNPRSWRLLPVLAIIMSSFARGATFGWRSVGRGVKWAWTSVRNRLTARGRGEKIIPSEKMGGREHGESIA